MSSAEPTLECSNSDALDCLIQKKVINAGSGEEPCYEDGTKIHFHYQTRLCDDERTVLDDSRKAAQPMELILGKKFKFETWETCLKTMRNDEIASFTADTSLCGTYPLMISQLRDIRGGKKAPQHHCCGGSMQQTGLGYPDLDNLMKNPQPLELILEVFRIEIPGGYNKESWCMSEDEKLVKIVSLQEQGNHLYVSKKTSSASEKYGEALGLLEQLILKEKPGDDEWNALDKRKIPLLLNFAQCKLLEEDYYAVIEHTTEAISRDPTNVKAVFRRAKGHVGAWNLNEAVKDYKKAAELDKSLDKSVNKELQLIADMKKRKDQEDREMLQGKMFT